MVFLSIVVPAYNEQTRLPSTLKSILSFVEGTPSLQPVEILVVDDGSTDSTVSVAEEFSKKFPGLKVLKNPGNRGKGYSIRHGMLEAQGQWVLFTDADLSAPIEEIHHLLKAANEKNASIAIGSRALDRSLIGTHQSWFRENAGRLFNFFMRVFVGLPFDDTQCGFKLFSQSAAKEVFRRQQIEGFGFDVEALFIGRKLGFHTIEVPVRWNHVEGTKVSFFKDSLRMFFDLMETRKNDLFRKYE